MLIIPAIDIKEGKVVRLWQGNFEQATVYSESPLETALFWEKEGAEFLHIVDLDGVLEGRLKNLELIKAISSAVKIPVEIGGGLRDKEDISNLLKNKVERVVIGTKAIEKIDWVKEIIKEFPQRIVVSLDVKEGFLATEGWIKKTSVKVEDFVKELKSIGIELFIFTDIERDGTSEGLRIDYIQQFLSKTKVKVIVAGGVGSLEDIRRLKSISQEGVEGVIVGRALYEKKFTLKEAMKIAK